MDETRYVPPPPFASADQRVAPVNEVAVLGHSSYPSYPPPPAYAPAPVWQPAYVPPSAGVAARRRRRVSLIVSLAVVAALVAIVAVLVSGVTASGPRSLTLPQTVDEYTQVTTLTGPQVQHVFGAGGTFANLSPADLAAAKVGVYSELGDSGPSMVFIGFDAADSPTLGAQLHHTAADVVAGQVLSGAGASAGVQRLDAGPLGGSLQCATVDIGGQPASIGVWADHDTLGMVLIVDSSLSAHTAAPSSAHATKVTRDFRVAAEH